MPDALTRIEEHTQGPSNRCIERKTILVDYYLFAFVGGKAFGFLRIYSRGDNPYVSGKQQKRETQANWRHESAHAGALYAHNLETDAFVTIL